MNGVGACSSGERQEKGRNLTTQPKGLACSGSKACWYEKGTKHIEYRLNLVDIVGNWRQSTEIGTGAWVAVNECEYLQTIVSRAVAELLSIRTPSANGVSSHYFRPD